MMSKRIEATEFETRVEIETLQRRHRCGIRSFDQRKRSRLGHLSSVVRRSLFFLGSLFISPDFRIEAVLDPSLCWLSHHEPSGG